MCPFRVQHKLSPPLEEVVPRLGHFSGTRIFADHRRAQFLFPKVVPETDKVEVRRDEDEGLGHVRVADEVREDRVDEEVEPGVEFFRWVLEVEDPEALSGGERAVRPGRILIRRSM